MPSTNRPRLSLALLAACTIGGALGICGTAFVPLGAAQGLPTVPGVKAVALSPDGKLLAAATGEPEQPGTVTVWDLATKKVNWMHREKAGIPAIAFAPDGRTLAIAVYNHSAKLLDVGSGKEKTELAHPAEVRGVAFSPDGKLLATTCWDGVARVWDLATGTEKVAC